LIALRFPTTEIQWFGRVAVLYSLYEVNFEYGGQPQTLAGRTTEVFENIDGHWMNTEWHVDSGK
jgi:hypothetical protein